MRIKHDFGPLTFGFDIGIASVGWAVLSQDEIVNWGVRGFDSGEDAKGKPHNQARRSARVARNRLSQRRWRLRRLLELFCEVGIIDQTDPTLLMAPPQAKDVEYLHGPWQLRARGLNEKLEPLEWARVIYHLVKCRGFKFFRTSELTNPDSDEPQITVATEKSQEQTPNAEDKKQLKSALEGTRALLAKYRVRLRNPTLTVGALAIWLSAKDYPSGSPKPDDEDRKHYVESLRNKGKDYRHSFFRDFLRDELLQLMSAQSRLGNSYVDCPLNYEAPYLRSMRKKHESLSVGGESRAFGTTFKDAVMDLFDLQHPPLYAVQIADMVGSCELEPEESRASKNAFSSERATWLEKLNHLRIRRDSEAKLSPLEHKCLINLPYEHRTVTLKLMRDTLVEKAGFPASWQEANFNAATYQAKPTSDGSWIYILKATGERIRLDKWPEKDKGKKERLAQAKKLLISGDVVFSKLRDQLLLENSEHFAYSIRSVHTIPRHQEVYELLLFSQSNETILSPGHSFRYIGTDAKARNLPKVAWPLLTTLRDCQAQVTLADWRAVLKPIDGRTDDWQFEHSTQKDAEIEFADEGTMCVPVQFDNPQSVEAETKFIELRGWHALRGAIAELSPARWEALCAAYREPQSENGQRAQNDLDKIATELTVCQTDLEISNRLSALTYTAEEINALQALRFTKFRNLGLSVLRKILPHLESGNDYSEACKLAGFAHSEKKAHQREKFLPPLETYMYERYRHGKPTGHIEKRYKELKNPVVARSFNQASLVFNALVAKHGSPTFVHVETARDLGKSKKVRDEISTRQNENRKRNDRIRDDLRDKLGRDPRGQEPTKMRLYLEQDGKCMYTGDDLSDFLNDDGFAEIDHIWPRSKTFDNSLENQVLVRAGANQNKQNRIPYEFLNGAGNPQAWYVFEKRVINSSGLSADKQRRLLAKNLDEADEFFARNLVDTRYATRLFANMVREKIAFAKVATSDELQPISSDDDGRLRWERYQRSRVRTPQGGLVAFLRHQWGLGSLKNREASDLHHAVDAAIIAACTPATIQQINTYFAERERDPDRYRFRRNADGTFTHKSTLEEITKIEAKKRGLLLDAPWGRHAAVKKLEEIFVSRKPKRKNNVEVHDANPKRIRFVPIQLQHLTSEMLADNVLQQLPKAHRGAQVVLRAALGAADGDAKKAFPNGEMYLNIDGIKQKLSSIDLPVWCLPDEYIDRLNANRKQARKAKRSKGAIADISPITPSPTPIEDIIAKSKTRISSMKNVPLTALKARQLSEDAVGPTFYHRNKKLIDALRTHLAQFNDDPKKAFAENYYHPLVKDDNQRRLIRSIRLPDTQGSGVLVRGGIAGLGESLTTEVYWTGKEYFFRPLYQNKASLSFGLVEVPVAAKKLFNLSIDEPIEILTMDGEVIPGGGKPGYFVVYEGDGRMRVRTHDRPGKSPKKMPKDKTEDADTIEPLLVQEDESLGKDHTLKRFSVTNIKKLRKYKVDVLGNFVEIATALDHGLA